MNCIFAETRFDCESAEGDMFRAELRIGQAETVRLAGGQTDAQLSVSFEPLFGERRIRGVDTFQALCLAIELVRDALHAFEFHGGRTYFPETKSPIDLRSPSFLPMKEPIDCRFLRHGKVGQGSDQSGACLDKENGAEA